MKRLLFLPWSLEAVESLRGTEEERLSTAYARQIPRYLSVRIEASQAMDAVFVPFCLEGEEGPLLVLAGQIPDREELREIGSQYEADFVVLGHMRVAGLELEVELQFVRVATGEVRSRTVLGTLVECQSVLEMLLDQVLREVLPEAADLAISCGDLSPRWEATAPFLFAIDRLLAAEIGERVTQEEVLEGFFAAVEGDPHWEGGALQLIGTALDFGMVEEGCAEVGVRALERLVHMRPQMHKAWEALGYLYHAAGRPDDVIRVMERARMLAPTTFSSYHRLSAAYRESKRFSEAEAMIRIGLQRDPSSIPLLNELGVVLGEEERLEESEACFRQLVELSPISGAFYANWGITLQRLGKVQEAEAVYQSGMRALDAHWNVYVNYTELLEEQERPLEWVQVLFAGIRALTEAPEERIDLATRLVDGVHRWIGDAPPPQAVQAKGRSWLVGLLESLVETLPEHQSSWVVLSELYRLEGRPEQALLCLERVAAADPDNIWLQIHINSFKASLE